MLFPSASLQSMIAALKREQRSAHPTQAIAIFSSGFTDTLYTHKLNSNTFSGVNTSKYILYEMFCRPAQLSHLL